MILKSCFVLGFFQIILINSEQQQKECRSFDSLISYPAARRNESVIDEYFGEKIADPYRWLENSGSNETIEYVDAQNDVTQFYLENCPEWHKIRSELITLFNHSTQTVPLRIGKYYFSMMNSGLQNQNILYKQSSLDDEPSIVVDPNEWDADGRFAIDKTHHSLDGSLVAYKIVESGSDTQTIKIRNVESGIDYPEELNPVQYSIEVSWTHDNIGFFYSRYPENSTKNENHLVYYHRVGESQDKDTLAFKLPDLLPMLSQAIVSDCGKYVILEVHTLKGVFIYWSNLDTDGKFSGKLQAKVLIPPVKGGFTYITNNGTKFIFLTKKDAPNYRLIIIDLVNPAEENWITLIKEDPRSVMKSVTPVANDKLLVEYIKDTKGALKVYSRLTGDLIHDIPLGPGFITEISSGQNAEFFIKIKTFLNPETIYRCDLSQPKVTLTVYRDSKFTMNGFDESQFESKQVFYHSRDGTRIPMFIIQKKTRTANGLKPAFLKAYGQFGMSKFPVFKSAPFHFVNSFDGIFAYPYVRGGGEYGDKWHESGKLLNKQNSFDDLQYAAKYLVENNYTEPKMMAIYALSAGALLPLVSINQQPDLFGAAVLDGTLTDMLRFHKFTIGSLWTSDFGNPDQEIHFKNIRKYSPLHNVHRPNDTSNQYPAMLFMASDHDNRVYPWHTLKFAATVQRLARNNQFQRNPILVKIYKNAGHVEGKPTKAVIDENADTLTFFYRALNIANISGNGKDSKSFAKTTEPSIWSVSLIFAGFVVIKQAVAI